MDLEAICIGMAVTDVLAKGVTRIPQEGCTEYVDSISVCTGGDALNEAITLARLGHRVGLMTLVGNDPQGDYIIGECRQNGVDVSAIARSHDHPTSTSIVLVNEAGERSFLSAQGASIDGFALEHIDLDYIRPGLKVLSIGSLFCGKALNAEALVKVVAKAKAVGATTIADFVPNPGSDVLDSIREVLPLLDYVVPSKEEAFLYTRRTDVDEIAEAFFRYGVKNAIVKLGGEGVFAKTPTDRFRVGLYPATVVDTTGAGDAFVAGLISGMIRGEPLRDCVKMGAATASIAIQSIGATTGVKSFDQVREVMVRNELAMG